jgi:hypothetical protein
MFRDWKILGIEYWVLGIRYWFLGLAQGVRIMSKLTIGSFAGAVCCLGMALIPIPFDRWVGIRQVGSVGAIGCGFLGWHESHRLKEEQEQLELWHFQQQQNQQAIDAAVNSAVADVLVQEVVTKEQLRAHASVQLYQAETQQNFVRVMAHDHPEILNQLIKNSETPTLSETKTDSASDIETKSDSIAFLRKMRYDVTDTHS